MTIEEITSAQNRKVKEIVELMGKPRERRNSNLFVVEGVRETRACIENGYIVESLFFAPSIVGERMETLPDLLASLQRMRELPGIFSLSDAAYAKIAYREGTEGVLATVRKREMSLEEVGSTIGKREHIGGGEAPGKCAAPLILVCEGIEKPGNIGAMLRTADAAGVDAVLLCDSRCDLFNPNLIRASLGSFFTQKIVSCSSREAGEWLISNGFQILTAQLQDSAYYYDTDMRLPTAIVMGSEADGLTDYWREISTAKIKIPMLGQMDSLNVSVSAAILCFEAVRQRIKAADNEQGK